MGGKAKGESAQSDMKVISINDLSPTIEGPPLSSMPDWLATLIPDDIRADELTGVTAVPMERPFIKLGYTTVDGDFEIVKRLDERIFDTVFSSSGVQETVKKLFKDHQG